MSLSSAVFHLDRDPLWHIFVLFAKDVCVCFFFITCRLPLCGSIICELCRVFVMGYHIKVGVAGVCSHYYCCRAVFTAQQGFRRISTLHDYCTCSMIFVVVSLFSLSRCIHEVLYDTVLLFFVSASMWKWLCTVLVS